METPLRRFAITSYAGLVTNMNPHTLPNNAAQEATNVVFDTAGELQVRKGMRIITSDNAVTAVGCQIISAFAYLRPEADYVITETSQGDIRLFRNPA